MKSRSRPVAHGKKTSLRQVLPLSLLSLLAGCGAAPALDSSETAGQVTQSIDPAPGDVVVSWTEKHQTISGFGAAAVFWGANITEQQAEFFFSQPKGLGLSLLRISAKSYNDNNGTTVPTYSPELETAKKAQALGARVWASSWTPPPAWKTNGAQNAKPGAHLQPAHYADFADSLATFAASMAAQGVPLLGVSPQNEPDYESDWEGCLWTPEEMTTFVRDHLGPKLAAKNLMTKVIAPDTAFWSSMPGYSDALLTDATAKNYVFAIATHPYGGGDLTYAVPGQNGKDFWETEVSQEHSPVDTPDPSMTSAITMLRMIHDHMTIANTTGWHWWALVDTDNPIADQMRQNPALIQAGVTFKRAYALGNFAKFVRPGMSRIGATSSPATDILVSAYRDDNRLSIVAVNASGQAHQQRFIVVGSTIGQIVPWVTSDTLSLAKQSPVTATDNFSYELPAKSVVTFVNWPADSESTSGGGAGGAGGQTSGGAGGNAGGSAGGGTTGGSATGGAAGSGNGDGGASAGIAGNSGASAVVTNGGGGTGGAPAVAGSASGGSSNMAGTATAAAGTATAAAGTATAAASAGATPSNDSGCSCRAAGSDSTSPTSAWLALAGLALVAQRRREMKKTKREP
jgi:glucuronoarabinoxylan endo-1,4-beta-xylanase